MTKIEPYVCTPHLLFRGNSERIESKPDDDEHPPKSGGSVKTFRGDNGCNNDKNTS